MRWMVALCALRSSNVAMFLSIANGDAMDKNLILQQCDIIEQAVGVIRAQCVAPPRPPRPSPAIDRDAVIAAVVDSGVPDIDWRDRGEAPMGYCKGMGIAYALVFREWLQGNAFALKMAKAQTGDDSADALSWYNSNFVNLRMPNNEDGRNTLRHLFVLMYGLGMRESSGKFCEGRDQSADNVTDDTAEAGLFQTSYDARYGCADITTLLQLYKSMPDDPQKVGPIFHEDVSCSSTDLQNYGSGDGAKFQYYQKMSPMLAVEACGVGMRMIGGDDGHWGPLRRKEAELKTEVDDLFAEVERIVENGEQA